MFNKENEDPAAMADKSRHPSKSILKDNTLPIPTNKRRVSFAPEVTLHKFDFVPYSDPKRRKTIGEPPSSQEYSGSEADEPLLPADEGLEILQDSSDLEADDSFTRLENEADLVVDSLQMLHSIPSIVSAEAKDEEEQEQEEQTMELTGQFNTGLDHNIPEIWSHPDAGNNEEVTMDFTGQINVSDPKPAMQSVAVVADTGSPSSDEDSGQESDMEMTGTQRLTPTKPALPTGLTGDEEITMDITNVPLKVPMPSSEPDVASEVTIEPTDLPEEVTMDITKVYSITKQASTYTETTQESAQSSSDSLVHHNPEKVKNTFIEANPEGSPEINEEGISTNQESNTKLRSLSIVQPGCQKTEDEIDEQTMDLTQVVAKISTPEESGERTMDLTEVASKVVPKDVINEESAENKESPPSNITIPEAKLILNNESKDVPPEDQQNQQEELPERMTTETVGGPSPLSDPAAKDQEARDAPFTESTESSELGSQPMQLTQENQILTKLQTVDDNDSAANVSTESIKQQIITTTTKVPLTDFEANNSQDDEEYLEDDIYAPVTLNVFMQDIGIKFYDDLDIDIYLSKRISMTTNSIDEEDAKLTDFMRAYSKLELLSLYQFSCDELSKNIQEGKKVFAEYNTMIESNNPALFREYYSNDSHERAALNVKLQLIKDYTRHQSKITWYGWRKQLTINLMSELETKHQALLEDKISFKKNVEHVKEVHNKAKRSFVTLEEKLKSLVRFKSQLSGLDVQKLQDLKSTLAQLSKNLKGLREDMVQKSQGLSDLEVQIRSNDELRQKLAVEIKEQEVIINNNRKYETEEVRLLNFKFKILQQLSSFKYKNSTSGSLQFVFDDVALLTIQRNSKIEMALTFKEFKELKLQNQWLFDNYFSRKVKLMDLSKGKDLILFKHLWDTLKQIDLDIYKLALKYPVSPVTTSEGVSLNLEYYSVLREYKLRLTISIRLDHSNGYRSSSSIQGKVLKNRNQIQQTTMKEDILQDFLFLNLLKPKTIEDMKIDVAKHIS